MYMPKTFQEIADERLGSFVTYDWAIPQPVFNDILRRTNRNPSGHIVWLYDNHAKIFGRPFGLTLLGSILMRICNYPEEELWVDVPKPKK